MTHEEFQQRLQRVNTVLNRWLQDQYLVLRGAYLVGGHQDHGGEKWKPRKEPAPHPLLMDTGYLRDATKIDMFGGAGLTREGVIKNTARFASFVHRERPLIVVTQQDIDRLRQVLQQYFSG